MRVVAQLQGCAAHRGPRRDRGRTQLPSRRGPAQRLGHVFAAGGVPHHGRDSDGVVNRAERAEAAGIRLEQAECGKRALGWIDRPTVAGDAER